MAKSDTNEPVDWRLSSTSSISMRRNFGKLPCRVKVCRRTSRTSNSQDGPAIELNGLSTNDKTTLIENKKVCRANSDRQIAKEEEQWKK